MRLSISLQIECVYDMKADSVSAVVTEFVPASFIVEQFSTLMTSSLSFILQASLNVQYL